MFSCCSTKNQILPEKAKVKKNMDKVIGAVALKAKYRNDRIELFGNSELIKKETEKLPMPKVMIDLVNEYAAPSKSVQNAVAKAVRRKNLNIGE